MDFLVLINNRQFLWTYFYAFLFWKKIILLFKFTFPLQGFSTIYKFRLSTLGPLFKHRIPLSYALVLFNMGLFRATCRWGWGGGVGGLGAAKRPTFAAHKPNCWNTFLIKIIPCDAIILHKLTHFFPVFLSCPPENIRKKHFVNFSSRLEL